MSTELGIASLDGEEAIKDGMKKLEGKGFEVDPKRFLALSTLDENGKKRCFMCKHKEDEAFVLPKGVFTPSGKWIFHLKETHGLPIALLVPWIFFYPYVDAHGNTALKELYGQWGE